MKLVASMSLLSLPSCKLHDDIVFLVFCLINRTRKTFFQESLALIDVTINFVKHTTKYNTNVNYMHRLMFEHYI